MWTQWWVVVANDDKTAIQLVNQALTHWTPEDTPRGQAITARIYRGPDDLALAEVVARDLSAIKQTVLQSHRQELSRRLRNLSHRAMGIPPREGWVVLDDAGPRSPRPLDSAGAHPLRWVVTVEWSASPPAS